MKAVIQKLRPPAYTWTRRSYVLLAALFGITVLTGSPYAMLTAMVLFPALLTELYWRREAEYYKGQATRMLALNMALMEKLNVRLDEP